MPKNAVINASPLIFLSRGGQLELLRHFADKVLVPSLVIQEIRAKGPHDMSVIAIERVSWLEPVASPAIPEIIAAWGDGARCVPCGSYVATASWYTSRRCSTGETP